MKEGDRIHNKETGEWGIVTYMHQVYPFLGDVTVITGGGAALWHLKDCEEVE